MPEDSRLSRMIARLTLQRAYLEEAASVIADVEGPAFEIGLGKGRTYDHLAKLLPARKVYAFDGSIHCPPGATPPGELLMIGDFRNTLEAARPTFEGRVALAHCDFGSEDASHDAEQAEWLAELVIPLMRGGGAVVSDRALKVPAGWQALAITGLPEGPFEYFGWRVSA